jgi:hypothetical protein
MNNTKKRTARAGLLAGSLALACGVTAFPASAAPTPKTQIKTTALSNTQDACSVHKSLGYVCTTFLYSVNGAGQAVVRPSVCFHQNQTTRRTVVTEIDYGARGSGANKKWVPTSAIAEPGQFWRQSECINVFTSWALRSPGAWTNYEVSDGVTVQIFTVYSPA